MINRAFSIKAKLLDLVLGHDFTTRSFRPSWVENPGAIKSFILMVSTRCLKMRHV